MKLHELFDKPRLLEDEDDEHWQVELDFSLDDETTRNPKTREAIIEADADKFAAGFHCTAELVQHNGPGGGASVFLFTGKKRDLRKLLDEYGEDDEFFDEYAEKAT